LVGVGQRSQRESHQGGKKLHKDRGELEGQKMGEIVEIFRKRRLVGVSATRDKTGVKSPKPRKHGESNSAIADRGRREKGDSKAGKNRGNPC